MNSFYIDLHLHLDGSLPPEVLLHLAEKQHISLPESVHDAGSLIPYVSVSQDCADLNEYLQCFDFPLQLLQTRGALEEAAYALLKTLHSQHVLYSEIRFAPQLHLQKGLTQIEAVQAVLKGIKAGEKDFPIQSQLILCCMRTPDPQTANIETIKNAAGFLGHGVCAVDLAGAEALFPTRNFKPLFALARTCQVPFTVHAGEAAGAESIQAALESGAQRIGHGIRCLEDENVVHMLKQKQIPLEICPTSNLNTKAIPGGIEKYPIMQLLDKGLNVTINTDNMTVSNTTLEQEFHLLETSFSLTPAQKKQLIKNAVFAAFLSPKQKETLWKKVEAAWNQNLKEV